MAKDKRDKQETANAAATDAPPQAVDEYSPESYETVLAERDEMEAKYQRALADYQNAQRRFSTDMAAAREAGVERVLGSLIPVLDHFDMALNQDPEKVSAEQMLAGVKMIRDEFNRAMAAFGVQAINPAANDEFDPNQHEALSNLAVEGVEPSHVSSVYQIGYRVNDRVVRAAKVTVAPEAADGAGEG